MTVSELQDAVLRWFQASGRVFPWRQSGIEPTLGLITELLLRKTTAEQVNKVYPNLAAHLNVFLSSGRRREELRQALKPLGLQQQRMAAIEKIVEYLQLRYAGRLPHTLDQLLEIPHVGPYVANATRCFYLDQPAPIVDANIARVIGRLFGVSGNTSNPTRTKAYWLLAAALVPGHRAKEYNWSLLDLGALICTPAEPKCGGCPISVACSYRGNSSGWRGLSTVERQELEVLRWDPPLVPVRLAELLGLSRVPDAGKVHKLPERYRWNKAEDGSVSELDLRRLAFDRCCSSDLVGQVGWIFGLGLSSPELN